MDEPTKSKEGLEWLFAVNHLAHFALTIGLMPALKRASASASGDVRIVLTTSAGFRMHPDPDSLHIGDEEIFIEDNRGWWRGAMPMYGRSKSCNILFAAELSRQLRQATWGKNIRVNSVHPGTVSTGLNRTVDQKLYIYLLDTLVNTFVAVSPDQRKDLSTMLTNCTDPSKSWRYKSSLRCDSS